MSEERAFRNLDGRHEFDGKRILVEIFNLKWFDLDFERGVIQVRKTKTKLNRVVPMNARVREVLNQQRRSSEFVFTSEKTGGRLVDVKKAFDAARIDAKIPDFQLRDLRHSCATRLSDQGEELVTVAEILGHTDIRMTKRYSHAMQERKRSALEKLVTFGSSRQPDAKSAENEKRQDARSAASALRTRRSAKLSYCPTHRKNTVSSFEFQASSRVCSEFGEIVNHKATKITKYIQPVLKQPGFLCDSVSWWCFQSSLKIRRRQDVCEPHAGCVCSIGVNPDETSALTA